MQSKNIQKYIKAAKQEERELEQKKLMFYQLSIQTQYQLRLNITSLLITISAAMIAALPYFYRNTKTKYLLLLALILYAFEILLGLAMNEYDSKQIDELIKQNDGEEHTDYSRLTGRLSAAMYIIIFTAFIVTIILGFNL